jgi:hypothetical protein
MSLCNLKYTYEFKYKNILPPCMNVPNHPSLRDYLNFQGYETKDYVDPSATLIDVEVLRKPILDITDAILDAMDSLNNTRTIKIEEEFIVTGNPDLATCLSQIATHYSKNGYENLLKQPVKYDQFGNATISLKKGKDRTINLFVHPEESGELYISETIFYQPFVIDVEVN